MNKKMLSTGLGLGLLAGAGAGMAWQVAGSAGASAPAAAVATTDPAVDSTTDSTADTAATAADHQPGDRARTALQPLVTDGTLTQAQLDKVIETLVASRPADDGDGPRGHGGGRGHDGGRHGIATVATTLGVDEQVVIDGLQSGQTIAEVAAANGSSAQKVIDALVAEMTSRLDAKVTSGEITQAEADTKLADGKTRITEFVNNTPAPGRHGADDGDADDATTTTVAG